MFSKVICARYNLCKDVKIIYTFLKQGTCNRCVRMQMLVNKSIIIESQENCYFKNIFIFIIWINMDERTRISITEEIKLLMRATYLLMMQIFYFLNLLCSNADRFRRYSFDVLVFCRSAAAYSRAVSAVVSIDGS